MYIRRLQLWRGLLTPVNPSHRQLRQLSPNDNELRTLTNRRLRMSNPSSHEPLWSVYRGDS